MKILVTAGPVYGALDDFTIVSPRTQDTWAEILAEYLCLKGHDVTFLVADTYPEPYWHGVLQKIGDRTPYVARHHGFGSYYAKCVGYAPTMDAAIMAADIPDWLPLRAKEGKRSSKGKEPFDQVSIRFYLVPSVIEKMKEANPALKLVGCKRVTGLTEDDLLDAADKLMERARCDAVLAWHIEDTSFRTLVYPDRSSSRMKPGPALYDELRRVLDPPEPDLP